MTTTTTTKVYKIVWNLTGHVRTSVFTGTTYRLEYEEDKVTLPMDGTYICAFDTLENATDFMRVCNLDRLELWEAETSEAVPLAELCLLTSYYAEWWDRFHRDDLKGWRIRCEDSDIPYNTSMEAPRGTVGCKDLILRTRIR